MNICHTITAETFRRFEEHVRYARRNGAALYESKAPSLELEGDDDNESDSALLVACLLDLRNGSYIFTQKGWEYARWLNS
jgi:hypothetical protein